MTTREQSHGMPSGWARAGVQGLVAVLAAGMLVLPAEEKDKGKNSQAAPHAAPPAKAAPAANGGGNGAGRGAAPQVNHPFPTGGGAPQMNRPFNGGGAPPMNRPFNGGGAPNRSFNNGGGFHPGPGQGGSFRTPGGAMVRHSPGGGRMVEYARPGGRTVYAAGGGHYGYVQAPFMYGGRTYAQRTYYRDGVLQVNIYRPWGYGGRQYAIYTPNYYSRPGFYAWAYNPWAQPVYYGWGWNSRPWYGYYGGYFTPYPSYGSSAFWLTDFIIANTLETAYLSQVNGGAPMGYAGTLPPDAKDAIAFEVRRQMDQERSDQSYANGGPGSAPPAIFQPNGPRVFLVNSDVPANADGRDCYLQHGDVIKAAGPISQELEFAQVRVMSDRPEMPRGTFVSVRTVDLQEMQNHLQATMDQGLDQLQKRQGQGGLPAAPPQAIGVVNAPYTNDLHPDAGAESQLDQAIKEAEQSEHGGGEQAPPAPAYDRAPSGGSIQRGMSMDAVRDNLGSPLNTVDLGAKQIFIYRNLKVIFLNGQVLDVQ